MHIQGSILGPVLFNLYLRTISSNGRSNHLLYTDDTTMLRRTKVINLPQTIDKMQQEMNEVNTWPDEKNLCLNDQKTKVIPFRLHQCQEEATSRTQWWRYSTKTSQSKYESLMTFDQHLTCRKHISATKNQLL